MDSPLTGIKAVLFDLDETLIHNTVPFEEVARELYAAFQNDLDHVSADEFWETLWGKAVDMWFMMYDGVLPGDEARRYTFINTLRALGADLDLAPAMLEAADARMVASTHLMEDARPVLGRLREAGFRLGVVTNGYATMQRKKIAYHELGDCVDFVLVSEEVGAHKPAPDIFEAAINRAGCDPENVLFVGDTADTDLEGACNAGVEAVLIDYDGSRAHHAGGGTRYIRRLGELLPLLGLE